jgi:hypothetical protein
MLDGRGCKTILTNTQHRRIFLALVNFLKLEVDDRQRQKISVSHALS